MDSACLPALAVIGLAVLPPSLRERVRRVGELDEAAAMAVRAEVEALAALVDCERVICAGLTPT